jgi:hypothetical protein
MGCCQPDEPLGVGCPGWPQKDCFLVAGCHLEQQILLEVQPELQSLLALLAGQEFQELLELNQPEQP